MSKIAAEALGCLRYRFFLAVFFVVLAASGCKETILHDLSEVQANRVKVLLSDAGIDAAKTRDGAVWSIAVEGQQATPALAVLDRSRILKRDIVESSEKSTSFIQSSEEKNHFLERSVAKGLEQTLERFPGVLEARVHLNLPPTRRFELIAEEQSATASVLLVSTNGTRPKNEHITSIVSGASGVAQEKVTVVIVDSDPSEGVPTEQNDKVQLTLPVQAKRQLMPAIVKKTVTGYSGLWLFIALMLALLIVNRKIRTEKDRLRPLKGSKVQI